MFNLGIERSILSMYGRAFIMEKYIWIWV